MDWAVTITIAVAAVLAIKAWVVNPYRIPSSSMEPTLHCADARAGLPGGRLRPRAREPLHLPVPRPRAGGHRRLRDPASARSSAAAPAGRSSSGWSGLRATRIAMRAACSTSTGSRRRAVRERRAARVRTSRANARGRRVLHDGRQPWPVLRQPRVGPGRPRRPDRPGIRRLLAADAARPAVTMPDQRLPHSRMAAATLCRIVALALPRTGQYAQRAIAAPGLVAPPRQARQALARHLGGRLPPSQLESLPDPWPTIVDWVSRSPSPAPCSRSRRGW